MTKIDARLCALSDKILVLKAELKHESVLEEMDKLADIMSDLAIARIVECKGSETNNGHFNLPASLVVPNSILLRATLPPEAAEDVIANLEFYYQTVWRKRHGTGAASAIFYAQNVRAILSHYAGVIRSTLELYLKRS